MALLQPKEIELELPGGGTKKYTISKFPAVAGREIVAKYPISAMPKLGDYAVSEETMVKLMSYVAIDNNGTPLTLGNKALIDNHVEGWETLAKLEMAMMEYNCSFLRDGRVSATLERFVQKVLQSISQTLTASSAPLSPGIKQP